jgi:hypothetical protein
MSSFLNAVMIIKTWMILKGYVACMKKIKAYRTFARKCYEKKSLGGHGFRWEDNTERFSLPTQLN